MKTSALTRRALFASAASVAAGTIAHAQGPAAKDTASVPARPDPADAVSFSVDVSLVQVGFSVRDRKGQLVQGLAKGDFHLFESGRKQEIKVLSSEEELPLSIALVIDRSGSQKQYEQENVYAAVTFFRSILREDDRAMIVAFSGQVKLVQDMTASLDGLELSLKNLAKNYDQATVIGPKGERDGESAVLDAAFWTVKEKLAKAAGRKVIVMIGDGRDFGSRVQLLELIDLMQANDVMFYGLDNAALEKVDSTGVHGRLPLIAAESGGRCFDTTQVPLRQAFDEIEQELRTMYTVGYASNNPTRDGRYRKIEIRPVDRSLHIRARPGYHAR